MNNSNFFPLERNRYFYGKMLTARDFETEQRYFNNKRRLLNRTLFGAGVVCGLGVCRNDDVSFSVETGMALDYMGREICVSTPVIRKLRMVDGFEDLSKSDRAYLCLQYSQENREPVNNIGAADSGSEQYNKIEEGYRLYLSTDEPDLSEIYGGSGVNSVSVVYSSHGLRIVRIVPKLAVSGDEITVRFVVIKGIDDPQVSFAYSFSADYFRSAGDEAGRLSFTEDPTLGADVFNADFALNCAEVSDTAVPLHKDRATISVQMGDFTDNVQVEAPEVYLCRDADSCSLMRETRMSTLEKHIGGENTPIYLAKVDCLNIGTGFIIRHITPLPFAQRVNPAIAEAHSGNSAAEPVPMASAKPDNILGGGIGTEVETLEYWQKPQVSAAYSKKDKRLNFRFGIPSAEAYDYATSSGVADIPISGAIRVNARFFSEDIPHNLGIGDVSISVSVEYEDSGERRLLFGDGEIFATKTEKAVPRIQAAALLSPEKGTFRIGIRLSDYVEGHSVRVRWFAYKPTRDTAQLRYNDNIVIRISPDIQKVKPLERVRFLAEDSGTEDKGVTWSVNDPEGGSIDDNGLYQAPSEEGTYEVVARSNADGETRTSAFVLVEE